MIETTVERTGNGDALNPGPIRMCVICRGRFPKSGLDRYVRSEVGGFVIDPVKTMLGRGSYVCGSRNCRDKFAKRCGSGKKCMGRSQ